MFDGQQVASLSSGRFCAGSDLTFLSSSNIMTAVFRSDAMITNTGFYALYNAIRQDERDSGRCPNTYLEGSRSNLCPFPLREEMLPKSDLRSPPSLMTSALTLTGPSPPSPCSASHCHLPPPEHPSWRNRWLNLISCIGCVCRWRIQMRASFFSKGRENAIGQILLEQNYLKLQLQPTYFHLNSIQKHSRTLI